MLEVTTLIQGRLAGHRRRVIQDSGQRRAAVLIPLYAEGGETFVLFTKRTQIVEHHKGEISFPGGAVDPDDPDLLSAALRETNEELGIPSDQIRILGTLDDVTSAVSGFIITPFVGWIPHPYPFKVNPDEISEILTAPLSVFRDPHNLRVVVYERGRERKDILFYHHGKYEIWGVTARILKGMIDLVFAGESA